MKILFITLVIVIGFQVTLAEEPYIKVYDNKGKEFLLTRDEYSKNVLPGIFEDAWNDENKLYTAIASALHDEFFEESLSPATRYKEISTNPESSAILLGIINMKLGKLHDAKLILQQYLTGHGDSGYVLTNLAKVYSEEGNQPEALRILWKGLTVDPNQDNAIDWWSALHYEKGGEEARIDSIRKIAKIPGSWRPQLWLARNHLESGNKVLAIELYKEILETDAKSHGDALMMISGDLGNNGYVEDAIHLIKPIYKPKTHGINPGLNLVLSYKQLRMKKDGLALINELKKLERYDLLDYLNQLESEISRL